MEKFSESFSDLLDGITKKLQVVVALVANPLAAGLGIRRKPDPCALVVFGASGDLTKRKLFPALYALAYRGLLPGSVRRHRRGAHRADHEAVPDRDAGRGQAVRARPLPLRRLRLACCRLRVRRDGVRRRQRRGPRRRRPGGGRSNAGDCGQPPPLSRRARRRRSRRSCARSASAASARAGRA